MPYFTEGQTVRDTLLERSGGTVREIQRGRHFEPLALVIEWPARDGWVTTSRYPVGVCGERLAVESPSTKIDIFRLGVDV